MAEIMIGHDVTSSKFLECHVGLVVTSIMTGPGIKMQRFTILSSMIGHAKIMTSPNAWKLHFFPVEPFFSLCLFSLPFV